MATRFAALALLIAVGAAPGAASAVRAPRSSESARVTATVGVLQKLGAHDPYTRRHMARVGANARAVAAELGLPMKTQRIVRLAGALHDVGKTHTPLRVLHKPGRLNRLETFVMHLHARSGERMLARRLGTDGMAGTLARVAGAHHEKFDGTGYPRRLAGAQIPLEARIVAVVDAYDAMTTQRSYNRRKSHDEAMAVLRADAGTHFDPDVVAAFERVQARARGGGSSSDRSAASSESVSSSAGTR